MSVCLGAALRGAGTLRAWCVLRPCRGPPLVQLVPKRHTTSLQPSRFSADNFVVRKKVYMDLGWTHFEQWLKFWPVGHCGYWCSILMSWRYITLRRNDNMTVHPHRLWNIGTYILGIIRQFILMNYIEIVIWLVCCWSISSWLTGSIAICRFYLALSLGSILSDICTPFHNENAVLCLQRIIYKGCFVDLYSNTFWLTILSNIL